MSKLISKARAGVTLVELLVVILIVTILSVSMLPLLQPFVVEAQYAAEAIPVIGNIRTKVGIYQYDKGKLPQLAEGTEKAKDDQGNPTEEDVKVPVIATWIPVISASSTTEASDPSAADFYAPAKVNFPSGLTLGTKQGIAKGADGFTEHIQEVCDIDYQDLKGKRSRPNHYQYLVMKNGTDYAYFVGVFGDGNGLKKGTGYAVCEIVASGHKYVGTWKRYKPVSDDDGTDMQLFFSSSIETPDNSSKTLACYVPAADQFAAGSNGLTTDTGTGKLNIVSDMEGYGWEF